MRTVTFWLSLILIFTIPWEAIITFPGVGTLTRALGLSVTAFWVFTVVVRGEFRKLRPFHLAVCLFMLWNVMSSFWSVNVEDTVDGLKTYAQLFGLSLILWDLYTTPATLKMGLQAYILGTYVSIASATKNYLAGNPSISGRYGASGFNVNDFSLILALGIPVAWYLAVSGSRDTRTYFITLVNYCYIPAAFFSIFLTASRGGLIATLPAILFILRSFNRLKLFQRILIFMVLTGILFALQPSVPQSSFGRLSTAGTSISTGDLSGRGRLWREGIEVFFEHPLLGVGGGGFRHATELGKSSHNTYLSVLVDLGIIGFVLFATILAITVYRTVHQPKWESRFWLTVLMILALGTTVHNAGGKKIFWLFLTLVIVSANLPVQHVGSGLRPEFPYAKAVRISLGSPLPVQGAQTKANHTSHPSRTNRNKRSIRCQE